jgi:hypothetical protein
VLLAVKDGLPYQYTSIFTFFALGDQVVDDKTLSRWLLSNRLPTALELGQETFQSVMNAPHGPLVVLVAADSDQAPDVEDRVKDVALRWRERSEKYVDDRREVVFTWMDSAKWGKWLKSMYGVKGDSLPAVVIVDHSVSTWKVRSSISLNKTEPLV